HFESQVYKRDGSIIWISENVNPIYDQGGLIGYEGSVEDITERKEKELEMENNLARLQELCEIKSKFVSMVSHEFRGGLSIILSSSDMLKVYGEKLTDTQKVKHFDKINHQVKELTDLLEDLLQFGKIEASKDNLQKQEIYLELFAQEIMEDLANINKGSHKIILNHQSGVTTILGDRLMLKRMLINLLHNAVKYSPAQSKIEFNISDNGSKIIFQVKDEGIGIPESEIDKLYTLFYRCNNTGNITGTGLGLAIVKKIVELHNGEIFVESTLGKGTTFTVSLLV
ncbi:MAG TPA: PAS domain-containing sensor histidine kinase, partial [Allocoleopsis sp.]